MIRLLRAIRRSVLFPLLLLLAQGALGADDIAYWLNLDRFQYYLGELAFTVDKNGHKDVAKALRAITPEQIHKSKPDRAKLADSQTYDELAATMLAKLDPKLKFSPQNLVWNYPFFKRKLGEGFVYAPRNDTSAHSGPVLPEPDAKLAVPAQPVSDFSFDFHQYIAHRTTRAAFWYAATEDLRIEFHLGNERDFRRHLAHHGAYVLGEIKPMGRNYNKLFLIQVPGEAKPRLAINRITGLDRLDHLARQVLIEAWNGKVSAAFKTIEVYGNPATFMKEAEERIHSILSALPPADRVIMGQKGEFEGLFVSAAKYEAIERLLSQAGSQVQAQLSPADHQRLMNLVKAVQQKGGPFGLFRRSGEWDKFYATLEPLFAKTGVPAATSPIAFQVENDSHDIADYLYHDSQGVLRRWRVFSNVWGDEIVPIANAVKRLNQARVTYIGTAGAFPTKNLDVGSLVLPTKVLTLQDQLLQLPATSLNPAGAIVDKTVAHVTTPFVETNSWLALKTPLADVVEVEVSYLAQIFAQTSPIEIALMVSDVLGEEGQSLDRDSSSKRKRALQAVLADLIERDDVQRTGRLPDPQPGSPAQLLSWLRGAAATRDTLSLYQVLQKARAQNLKTEADAKKLLGTESSFTRQYFDKHMAQLGEEILELRGRIGKIKHEVRVGRDFQNGSWNPKDALPLALVAANASDQAKIDAAIVSFLNDLPARRKRYEFQTPRGPPDQVSIAVTPDIGPEFLLEAYHGFAFTNASLVSQVGRTGAFSYVLLPSVAMQQGCNAPLLPQP